MSYKRFIISFFLILSQCSGLIAQNGKPVYLSPDAQTWADSVFKTMSYDQKIGQLFMVDAFSNRDSVHVNFIDSLVRDYHIGGVIFFQGGPVRQAILTNRYQKLAQVPLIIGIDGEWGLAMRLDSTIRFPRQMTLGALKNDSLIYLMGKEIGQECRRMGIQLNFAPVADINNNPLNPVINSRSFGDNREDVARKSIFYMNGLQDMNILACGKHFPGHGSTDSDSHFTLPMIRNSYEEIDSVEFYPFRELIRGGIASMMVGHLFVPALDTTTNQASTLSNKIVTGLLVDSLKFNGLIFTDALNMKGVANYYKNGDLELKALQAGNDVLLYSSDVPTAFMRIHYAIQNCELEQELIDTKVKKILEAKYWTGLNHLTEINTDHLQSDLQQPSAIYLNKQLYEQAITLLGNNKSILPIQNIKEKNIASLAINDTINNPFQLMLSNYAPVSCFRADKEPSQKVVDSLVTELQKYEYVILSIHNTSTKAANNYGISDKAAYLLNMLRDKTKLITVLFGNSYGLIRLPGIENSPASIIAYEDTYWPQYYTAQAIFGGAKLSGKLPVTPVTAFARTTGLALNTSLIRIRYTDAMESGLSSSDFAAVDSIAMQAVTEKATPGCQVLVAWKGRVIYQKSFANYTYDDTSKKVTNTDLYDIASLTKIAATGLAVMKLYEDGKIDITKKASHYFKELKKTNKKDIIISDILTHQAGLQSWIPFWKDAMENGKLSFNIFHREKDVNYSTQVCDSLLMLNTYRDKIWESIYKSPLGPKGKYVYSDLGMLIMQHIVEDITDMPLDQYLNKNFYEPLGLSRLTFNPLKKFPREKIVPTEIDTAFRKQLIWGYVHDPAAAMLGGMAGNAGLFSDAGSLAIIMQMFLNGGTYGGKQYLKRETLDDFTARFNKMGTNRRGLIFDKPETDPTKNGPTAPSASFATYGHTGFTGTCAWVDPENDLVFIFLSNRVYPDATNSKLVSGNFRTRIMEAVYQVILKKENVSR